MKNKTTNRRKPQNNLTMILQCQEDHQRIAKKYQGKYAALDQTLKETQVAIGQMAEREFDVKKQTWAKH